MDYKVIERKMQGYEVVVYRFDNHIIVHSPSTDQRVGSTTHLAVDVGVAGHARISYHITTQAGFDTYTDADVLRGRLEGTFSAQLPTDSHIGPVWEQVLIGKYVWETLREKANPRHFLALWRTVCDEISHGRGDWENVGLGTFDPYRGAASRTWE